MFGRVESFCLFAGYTRSGHSLVGTILDAHPNVVVAHEGQIFEADQTGVLTGELRYRDREELYRYLTASSARHRAKGRRGRRRDAPFPLIAGASNGVFTDLRVIGVKRGQEPPMAWEKNPAIVDELEALVGVPVRLLHVYRNPWDNISSMARTRDRVAVRAASSYFRAARTMQAIKQRFDTYDLALEDLIAGPVDEIGALLDHFGLERDEDFLAKAAAAVDESPNASRHEQVWSDADTEFVVTRKRDIPWLERYPDTPE